MKVSEVREFPDEELRSRLEEVSEELFNLRFQNATGQLENYKRLGTLKRDAAKILTVLREREMGIEPPPVETKPEPKRRRTRPRRAEPQDLEDVEEEETSDGGT